MNAVNARFRDRRHAGRLLAQKLLRYRQRPDVIVLGLPRGGVPVAFEVARQFGAPLDVFIVRKLGAPGNSELAMGAIAPGVRWMNWDVIEALGVTQRELQAVIDREERELQRGEQLYRGHRPWPALADRVVLLIDDGLATGASMRVAVSALREQHPARIVVGVPVGAPSTCRELRAVADEVVCALTPDPLYAVGLWYEDFTQTTDEEVRTLLDAAARERAPDARIEAHRL